MPPVDLEQPGDATAPERDRRRAPLVWPTVVAVCLVVGLAALVLPGFRRELTQSLVRQPLPFVELSLVGQPAVGTCSPSGRTLPLTFRTTGHDVEASAAPYAVTVRPESGSSLTRRGTVEVRDGATTTTRTSVTVPADGAFVVEVSLPAIGDEQHGQSVRALCRQGG